RWTGLLEGGAGTEQQLDRAVTAFERAQAELNLAQAQIKQAEAALAQAKVNLDKATIEAPFSGVVSRKYVDEGAFVGPTTPLFKLVDIHQVEITGGVAGRHYPKLKVGQTRAEVQVDAYPGETFSGRLSRVRPELDRATRTVAVTVRMANEDGRLKPGMYARIKLVLQEHDAVPLVPDEALLTFGDETRVYVVNGGEAHARKVRIGLEEGNLNEVLEGLRPGERVVVRGKEMLREGAPVEALDVKEVDAR
ncbi:MAG: efflux RND transporter periplasmic adaptor subunit, partial [Planctomycetes bacterium]|nr:efflux RND transporter periplasmic adaptor subunit [Planctomycetota bacterium]